MPAREPWKSSSGAAHPKASGPPEFTVATVPLMWADRSWHSGQAALFKASWGWAERTVLPACSGERWHPRQGSGPWAVHEIAVGVPPGGAWQATVQVTGLVSVRGVATPPAVVRPPGSVIDPMPSAPPQGWHA